MVEILLVEDDRSISRGILIALSKDGNSVHPAYNYQEGMAILNNTGIHLIILDINLPDKSGLEFCKEVRKTSSVPIIFLTANDTEQDIIDGFKLGCDDYLAKPFSIEILRQRISAILRRTKTTEPETSLYTFKGLSINFNKMTVSVDEQEIRLTATEFKMLEYLVKNRGQVLTRSMMLEKIWDMDGNYIGENTLSVHIRRLRQKLEKDPKNPGYIITVFGIGYTFGD